MMTETQRARRLEQIREGLELAREFHPSRQLKMLNWIFGDVNVAIENNVRRVAQRNLIARIAAAPHWPRRARTSATNAVNSAVQRGSVAFHRCSG